MTGAYLVGTVVVACAYLVGVTSGRLDRRGAPALGLWSTALILAVMTAYAT